MIDTNEVRFEISTACNHSCKFCPHSDLFIRKKQIMSFKLFKSLLDKVSNEYSSITDCTVSGFGEAFADPGAIQKIEYAREQNYNIHILTNGTLLTKSEAKQLLDWEIADIRISLHTVDKNLYPEITGGTEEDFDHVTDLIEFILENKKSTRLVITADIIKENQSDVSNIIDRYSKVVDLLEIWKPHNWVDGRSYRQGKIAKKTCGRPFKSPIQIQVDGTINMCCFDYNGQLLLGDLKTQPLWQIFSSEAYLNIRKHHEGGTIAQSNLICKKCDQLYNTQNVVIYNSKFTEKERLNRTSTNYRAVT